MILAHTKTILFPDFQIYLKRRVVQTPQYWAENDIWPGRQKAKERHQDESKKKEYIVKIFTQFKKHFESAEESPHLSDLKQREKFFKSNKEWFSIQEAIFHIPGMEAARELEAGSDSDAMDDSDGDWDGSSETDSDNSNSSFPDGDVDGADDAAGSSDGIVIRSEVTAVLVHVPEQQEQKQS